MKDGNPVEESKEDGAQIVTTDMVDQEEDLSNYVTVDGIIIKQDFDHLIMEESEVDKYTPLQSASMQQTLYVPYQHEIQVLGYFLHSYYAQVDVEFPNTETMMAAQAAESNIGVPQANAAA